MCDMRGLRREGVLHAALGAAAAAAAAVAAAISARESPSAAAASATAATAATAAAAAEPRGRRAAECVPRLPAVAPEVAAAAVVVVPDRAALQVRARAELRIQEAAAPG